MERYGKIISANPREIVLLKGRPCVWGKCAFCDYIHDNSDSEEECDAVNKKILSMVTGEFSALEAINSASVFELSEATLKEIKRVVAEKKISLLYFESYYNYKERLEAIKEYFNIPIIFKCGIETFNADFRNKVLKKGVVFKDIDEIKRYFQSVCIMVGVQGQTKEMIAEDIRLLRENFEYGCVNVYCNNSTAIRQDDGLIEWFTREYTDWDKYPHIDVLYHNTDFGVGD